MQSEQTPRVQVFATALDTHFQLTVMLMILLVGLTLLQYLVPFADQTSQKIQVSLHLWHTHEHA